MKTIIHLDDTKISPLIFLSSRAIMSRDAINRVSTNPWDSHYQFETILLSKDDRLKSHKYAWGSSSDYFLSFRLFQYTAWIHKRIAKRIRYHLQRLRILEKIEKLKAEVETRLIASPESKIIEDIPESKIIEAEATCTDAINRVS